jgi:hypothetical protein
MMWKASGRSGSSGTFVSRVGIQGVKGFLRLADIIAA